MKRTANVEVEIRGEVRVETRVERREFYPEEMVRVLANQRALRCLAEINIQLE